MDSVKLSKIAKRDSQILLNDMFATIATYKYNPIMSKRALRAVVRGEVDTTNFSEMRDITHAIFDWMCEFDKTAVSDADSALLKIDLETITNKEERIKVGRTQRKAMRRVRRATASSQSKVDPSVVEAVAKRIESSHSFECAADALWFASGLMVELKPVEIIEFLEGTKDIKSSWWNTQDIYEWAELVRQVHTYSIVKNRVSLWIGIYLAGHTWELNKLLSIRGLTNSKVLKYHQKPVQRRNVAQKVIANNINFTFAQYQRILGSPVDTQMLADAYGTPAARKDKYSRLVLSACQVNYVYKVSHDYQDICVKVIEASQKARNKSSKLKVDEIWELVHINNREFKTPEVAIFENHKIGEVYYTTIVDSASLKRNSVYMGNCTYRAYLARYKSGTGVLFVVKHKNKTYNVDLTVLGGRWRVREVSGRHSRTVTPEVRASIAKLQVELKRNYRKTV